MPRPRWPLPFLSVLLLAAAAAAQDDLRDVVQLQNGKELHGRVLSRNEPDEVVILQGGKRVRVATQAVAAMTTVRDHLREFFKRRDQLFDNASHRWIVAEWAASNGLPAMARLQALHVVLRDPDHVPAHELLGHRKRGSEWLWPLKDRWVPLAELQAYFAEWGHPLVLDGEHFQVRTNGTVMQAVDAVFDLERLYLWWLDTFGTELQLREVVAPKLTVLIWKDPKSFPAWSSFVVPYFRARVATGAEAQESTSYTWFEGPTGRPVRLYEVAMQHLLYRTLADDPDEGSPKQRLCAWAEIGLGEYVNGLFQGPPGQGKPAKWHIDPLDAKLVQERRYYGLEILTHRQMKQYYITVADNTDLDWASTHLFVAFLMDDAQQPSLRAGFLQYLFGALRKGQGQSSVALDRALGTRVETLEKPWRTWIEQQLTALKAAQVPNGMVR
jgi:hypothetical protein